MTKLKKLAGLSTAAMLLASGSPVESSSAQRILIECTGKQYAPLCAALTEALVTKFPDHTVLVSAEPGAQADMTIRYVEKHQAANWLSGQLTWRSVDGQRGEGSIIEYSVMDRKLNSDDMKPFALQLVRSTEFPQ